MEDKTRARVDAFARSAIVNAHPEWLENALSQAEMSKEVIGLHEKGPNPPFAGLENGKTLMTLLDAAPLSDQDVAAASPAAKEAASKLSLFSADQKTYYRIAVISRAVQPEILTFAEADKQGALDKILDSNLEAYYSKIRDANPKEFQRDDKSWKTLDEVKDLVADRYFEKILRAIATDYAAAIAPKTAPPKMLGDFAATVRLYPYVREMKARLQKDPASNSELTVAAKVESPNADVLPAPVKLADQWKMEHGAYKTTRSSGEQLMDATELFSMAVGTWTAVNTPSNGDLNFFHLMEKGMQENNAAIAANIDKAKKMLSSDAQQRLMGHLLTQIAAKDAISLDYLNQNLEAGPAEIE